MPANYSYLITMNTSTLVVFTIYYCIELNYHHIKEDCMNVSSSGLPRPRILYFETREQVQKAYSGLFSIFCNADMRTTSDPQIALAILQGLDVVQASLHETAEFVYSYPPDIVIANPYAKAYRHFTGIDLLDQAVKQNIPSILFADSIPPSLQERYYGSPLICIQRTKSVNATLQQFQQFISDVMYQEATKEIQKIHT